MCELFYFGSSACRASVERMGSVSHFLEAAMATALGLLSLYTAVVLGRLLKLYAVQMGTLSTLSRQARLADEGG